MGGIGADLEKIRGSRRERRTSLPEPFAGELSSRHEGRIGVLWSSGAHRLHNQTSKTSEKGVACRPRLL